MTVLIAALPVRLSGCARESTPTYPRGFTAVRVIRAACQHGFGPAVADGALTFIAPYYNHPATHKSARDIQNAGGVRLLLVSRV